MKPEILVELSPTYKRTYECVPPSLDHIKNMKHVYRRSSVKRLIDILPPDMQKLVTMISEEEIPRRCQKLGGENIDFIVTDDIQKTPNLMPDWLK